MGNLDFLDLILQEELAVKDERRFRAGLLCTHGITGGPGWLIDMLALSRLRLQNPAPGNKSASGPH